MKSILKGCCALVITLVIFSGLLCADINDELKKLEPIKTLRADFVQETNIEGFGKDFYKGKIYLISSEKVLWDYSEPYNQHYIFTVDTMEYYDSTTNQLIRQSSQNNNSNAIIFFLLMDLSSANNLFDIVNIDANTFRLNPKSDLGLKFVDISFGKNFIREIISQDNVGNLTKVTFSNIKFNIKIPKSTFKKDIPKDAEIFSY